MAKKTYICEFCNLTFERAFQLRDHERTREHSEMVSAVSERRRAIEGAEYSWKAAHLPACGNELSDYRALIAAGIEEHLAYTIASETISLSKDVEQLRRRAANRKERIERDLELTMERGAESIYSSTFMVSAEELAREAGMVEGRHRTLRAFASALGVRCESTHAPSEWAYLQHLATYSLIADADGSVTLTCGAMELTFKTADDAKLFATKQSRELAERVAAGLKQVLS